MTKGQINTVSPEPQFSTVIAPNTKASRQEKLRVSASALFLIIGRVGKLTISTVQKK